MKDDGLYDAVLKETWFKMLSMCDTCISSKLSPCMVSLIVFNKPKQVDLWISRMTFFDTVNLGIIVHYWCVFRQHPHIHENVWKAVSSVLLCLHD